jgi:4'-phosphopantetheinyl transferase
MAGATLAPPLAAGQIHLWWIDLDARAPEPRELSADERARAGRFVFPQHRDRYLAAHGAMRTILADYLGTDSQCVCFVTSPTGKPAIDIRAHGADAPAFNLSHSQGHAALAVAREGCLGVDLEVPKPNPRRHTMLGLLAPRERAAAEGLDDAALSAAFLVAWTRKEACLKALGSGFSVRPQQIEAGLDPAPGTVQWSMDPTPASAAPAMPPPEQAPVHVLTLQSPAGISTSLARVGEPITDVRTFRFPEPDSIGAGRMGR